MCLRDIIPHFWRNGAGGSGRSPERGGLEGIVGAITSASVSQHTGAFDVRGLSGQLC
jgi:hypothetical protein